jgi:hypothetical protein
LLRRYRRVARLLLIDCYVTADIAITIWLG